jgi:hypothetical protein
MGEPVELHHRFGFASCDDFCNGWDFDGSGADDRHFYGESHREHFRGFDGVLYYRRDGNSWK